jgi:hypothetical protein
MSEDLIFSRIFPPRDGQAWRYYLWEVITDFPRVVKYSWQRARRGWADCDIWSVDIWFMKVIPEMLEKLAKNDHGFPIDFEKGLEKSDSGHNAWKRTLQQMAHDLRALQRHEDRWFGGESPRWTKARHDGCMKEEEEAYSKVKAGLLSFYEYFFSLWD